MIDQLLQKLVDAYQKRPDSNVGKVLTLVSGQTQELQDTFEKIEAWRAIDNAEGKVLDDIGQDLNQYRGDVPDEIYRILLKSKVARDMSEGDTNTIIEVLSMAIDTDPSEITITETWMDEDNPEPSGISIIEIPIERLNEVGMSGGQFARFVAASVAAGVLVKQIDLEGTFTYGGDTLETDMAAGFGSTDSDDGGFYGALYNPQQEQDLPL